jgi:sec-independent protein translocase protein TatC
MSNTPTPPDPDDIFADTRMSFGDHIEDLRVHLWRAIKGFFLCCILGFFLGKPVLAFIARPVEEQLQAFYDNRAKEVERKVKEEDPDIKAATKASSWYRVRVPAAQFRAALDRDLQTALKRVNEFEKPKDDLDDKEVFHFWQSQDNPVDVALATFKATQLLGRRPTLSTLSVSEALMVYMKVSLVTGFVLGSPWIFFQIWSFVAAGLYPHEKKYVHVYLPFSLGLFLIGVLVCEFLVMPKAVEALLWFNQWLGLEPDMRLNEWLGFAIMMPVVFGLSFQTPLVMLFLNRLGIMTVDAYRDKRRIIWFLMAVFAAIITPSVDPYGMLFLWVPMCLLFELGIYMCLLSPAPYRRTPAEEDEQEYEGLIEV